MAVQSLPVHKEALPASSATPCVEKPEGGLNLLCGPAACKAIIALFGVALVLRRRK